ncbi:MAG: orotidine-5'-phosphate decarboxylase [Actinobacteria bacterium]|uniref:Orotidine 5'-phosphate decarboxylase n=1 Tax=freshwater metagenome TaxID=449393 RepID=A0A6J6PY15_9ZZZZ|nr:orotidine-5'-phosphate decarboxylase [Actinomycetota bacterium]
MRPLRCFRPETMRRQGVGVAPKLKGMSDDVIAFADRLAAEVKRKQSQLVVGLDPRPDLLPVELRGDVARFCCGIIDAVAPHAVGVKPQLAFFEALGSRGIAAFEEVCEYSRRAGLLVIADGKRGDIGATARAYADAYLEGEPPIADALTVNPYLGRESIEPYLAAARRYGAAIFCLVKTSNAGGDIQDVTLSDGRPLWHHVAEHVADWGSELIGESGLSAVGAVVGATHPRAVAEARKMMPNTILLLPGVGAQGADPADLARAFRAGPASALVNASRSVIFAYRETGDDYRAAAGAEAARLRSELWAVSGW